MKALLCLTLLASFAGGFFFGVYATAGEVTMSTLFLLWSCLDMGIAFHLINQITKRNYAEHR